MSMADLLVGVLFIFLILVFFYAINYSIDKENLNTALGELNQMEGEIESLKKKRNKVEEELSAIKVEKEKNESQINKLQSINQKIVSKSNELNTTIYLMKIQIAELQKQNDSEKNDLIKKTADLKQKIIVLTQKLENANSKLFKLSHEISLLKWEALKDQEEIQEKSVYIDLLEDEKYKTENDLIKKQAQMVVQQKKLEEQRDQAEERADTAEKKVGDLSEILLTINDTKIDLLEKIQNILQGKGFNVSIDTRNGILRLPEGALFSSGSYKLSSQGKVNMDLLREALEEVVVCYAKSENAVAQKLKENCEDKKHKIDAFLLEGHADKIPPRKKPGRKYETNLELSTLRAITAFNVIIESDILNSLRNSKKQYLMSVSGYGSERPICNGDSKECLAQNRRIDLRIIMEIPKELERGLLLN